MKNTLRKTLLAIGLFTFIFGFSQKSHACVNPDTTIVGVKVSYDTVGAPFITNVVIRLTNLRLMNENPNKVCACALTKWSAMFSNLKYLAFVYAGTNTPYKGFASFDTSMTSSNAWNNSTTSGDWAGYIATVVNAGLKATEAVDLVIRASTPSGVQYTLNGDSAKNLLSLVKAVKAESLGTDEWNNSTKNLVNAHRGIQDFSNAKTFDFTAMPSTYFKNIDTAILNNITSAVKVYNKLNANVHIYPVPSSAILNIDIEGMQGSAYLVLINQLGQLVLESKVITGVNQINISSLNSGLYTYKISGEAGTTSGSILVE